MTFHDLTITAAGERHSTRTHDTESLAAQAVDFFRAMLGAGGRLRRSFTEPIPLDGLRHLALQWTSETDAAALATFAAPGQPLTTSALLRGTDAEADRKTLSLLQRLLLDLMRPHGIEPGFDLLAVRERPVIVSVVLPGTPHPDLPIVADMETCLAAAFFTME